MPDLNFSEFTLEMAEKITLADLLQCPASSADTISLISNVSKHSSLYAAMMEPEDQELELLIHRLNNMLDGNQRQLAFAHLQQRRIKTS